ELIGRVKAANDNMAARGMRVLAMAYRYLPPEDEALLSDLAPGEVEQNMVFAGLTGMVDAPRDEVAPAVTTCRAAGIRVVMITGDYGVTAEAIARQVGILPAGVPAMVVAGAHLEAMNDAELEDVLGTSQPIFARATPEHKLRVVEALQRMGHVVAVTGDGVNDAPALKKADIGVAMGIMGTDVAREAAEMVRGYGFLGLMTTAVVLTAFMLFLTSHAWAWGQRAPLSASVAAGATTITFLGIVVMQVGNAFACRAERT